MKDYAAKRTEAQRIEPKDDQVKDQNYHWLRVAELKGAKLNVAWFEDLN